MSAGTFKNLTVVFQSPKTETVELPTTRFQRLWSKLRSRPLPTMEVPHFHTVTVDETHDVDTFEDLTEALEGLYGYSIVSVVVNSIYGSDELVGCSTVDAADVSALFTAIANDTDEWESFVAYVTGIEWTTELADYDFLSDKRYGHYDSEADFAMEFVDGTSECLQKVDYWTNKRETISVFSALPSYVDIDWQGTADNLSDDFDYVHYNGEVFVFSK